MKNSPRIKCTESCILIGDIEFFSASEALEAYISQYNGNSVERSVQYKRTTADLLAPKSSLQMTLDRPQRKAKNDDDVRRERKFAEARKSIDASYKKMKKSIDLRADVQDALNRSTDLLDRLSKDELPAHHCPSDIGSLNTDLLLSENPLSALNMASERKQGHIYSYRTSRPRSKTLSTGSTDVEYESALKGANLFSKPETESYEDTSCYTARQGRTSSRPPISMRSKITERSRSVSPASYQYRQRGFATVGQKYTPDWERNSMEVRSSRTPTWVDVLDLSNTTNNVWNRQHPTEGRRPPSWVHDIDGSDITSGVTSVSGHHVHFEDMLYKNPKTTRNQNLSEVNNSSMNAPGLSFRDLLPPSPLKRETADSGIYDHGLVPGHGVSDFAHNIRVEDKLSDVPWAESDILFDGRPHTNGMKRSSSLDTLALLAGKSVPEHAEPGGITVPDHILEDQRPGGLQTSTPIRSGRPQTPDTDIVLDGDRTWENIKPFKSPVAINRPDRKDMDTMAEIGGDKSPTFTGKQQPGSMEALKNMLFKLQEAAHQDGATDSIATTLIEKLDLKGGEVDQLSREIPTLQGYNFQDEPGGESLERAMVHLSRLKNLVQTGKDTATSLNNSLSSSPSKSVHKSPRK
ncbi:hypothetical protein ScPMuIL_018391 [Solemya velum]